MMIKTVEIALLVASAGSLLVLQVILWLWMADQPKADLDAPKAAWNDWALFAMALAGPLALSMWLFTMAGRL